MFLNRRFRHQERLHAMGLSICMSICVLLCLWKKMQKCDFYYLELLRAMVSIDKWRPIGNYMGFSKNPLTEP